MLMSRKIGVWGFLRKLWWATGWVCVGKIADYCWLRVNIYRDEGQDDGYSMTSDHQRCWEMQSKSRNDAMANLESGLNGTSAWSGRGWLRHSMKITRHLDSSLACRQLKAYAVLIDKPKGNIELKNTEQHVKHRRPTWPKYRMIAPSDVKWKVWE